MSTTQRFEPAYFRERDWWRDETIRDWLDRGVAQHGDRPAIVTADLTLTYRRFSDRVRAFAAGLHQAGMCRGDIIAVHLPNISEFLIAWLGINEIGAVMQTIHTPYGPREVEHLLRHSGAKACIALAQTKDRSPAGDIANLVGSLPNLKLVIAVGGAPPGTVEFSEIENGGLARPVARIEIAAIDPFLQLYTSGTTSSPKAVSVTHNHFLSNARMCAAEFEMTRADRILCLAPYTHLYGLYTFQLGFSVGAAACLLDLFTPPAMIQAIQRLKPTFLFAGPAHVAPCLQQNLFKMADLLSIEVAVLSGTTVPVSLSAAFEDLMPNGKVLQAWGMTELQFGACSRRTDSKEIRFGTIGRATPGTELRVVDADDKPLPGGEQGELHVRGCSLFSGYVGNVEATKHGFTGDGWFRTGDLARMDAEGNVTLCGRTKELINRGGVKFNPIDLEIAIANHPSVAQVAIAPLPDKTLGERASCFVVLKPGASLKFDQLKKYLADKNFARFTWPEHFVVVDEMPMTPTRKVMKAELVRRYLQGRAAIDCPKM
jgi:cyclohexanecarboxylate-CoA ligase/acyl-CoA synthetase